MKKEKHYHSTSHSLSPSPHHHQQKAIFSDQNLGNTPHNVHSQVFDS